MTSLETKLDELRLSGMHSRLETVLAEAVRRNLSLAASLEWPADLDFIAQGTNLVIIGNPGTGKTFLARIIAWKACQANYRVLFTSAMDMLNQLLASQIDHSLIRRLKVYTAPALLVCDLCADVSNVE